MYTPGDSPPCLVEKQLDRSAYMKWNNNAGFVEPQALRSPNAGAAEEVELELHEAIVRDLGTNSKNSKNQTVKTLSRCDYCTKHNLGELRVAVKDSIMRKPHLSS